MASQLSDKGETMNAAFDAGALFRFLGAKMSGLLGDDQTSTEVLTTKRAMFGCPFLI